MYSEKHKKLDNKMQTGAIMAIVAHSVNLLICTIALLSILFGNVEWLMWVIFFFILTLVTLSITSIVLIAKLLKSNLNVAASSGTLSIISSNLILMFALVSGFILFSLEKLSGTKEIFLILGLIIIAILVMTAGILILTGRFKLLNTKDNDRNQINQNSSDNSSS